MVERTHPEKIWAYDDGAHVMAFEWDNTAGGAVEYVRAETAERAARRLQGTASRLEKERNRERKHVARIMREKEELRKASEKALEQAENQWKQWEARAETAERQLAERDADLVRMTKAFAAQSRKLQSVLHIAGVRETLAELKWPDDAALAGSGDGWRATLTREEAEKLCARLEFDASWDKAGHGYYSLKRQLAASPSTAGER